MLTNNHEWCTIATGDWGLYQRKDGLRFTMDAVLLADFAQPKNPSQILDIGTGTGIIPFLLAAYHPSCQILGIDIQSQLVDVAHESRKRNGISLSQVDFQCHDARKKNKAFANAYDYVTCNPPFFPANHGAQNPDSELSLARHDLTLSIEELCAFAAYSLKQRGKFALIHRAEHLPKIMATAQSHKLAPARLRLIHPNAKKGAKLFLLECIYEGRQRLIVEPALMVYQADGSYHPDLIACYKGDPNHA